MKIKQAIVTSCAMGILGQHGVCLYSMSEGIDSRSLDDFQASSAYQFSYLYTDSIDDLPTRFSCGRDPGGNFYLHSVQSILDYGKYGRVGNVMSHRLMLSEGDKLELPPICYYHSRDIWRRIDPALASNPAPPEPLPLLEGLCANPDLSFEKIARFVQQVGFSEFAKVLSCLLRLKKERKRLVIIDTPENTVAWICALEYALSPSMNANLPFSTYIYDMTTTASRICGYAPGISQEYSFTKEDIVLQSGKLITEPPKVPNQNFLLLLKTAYLGENNEELEAFHGFLEAHQICEWDEWIYAFYDIYMNLASEEGLALNKTPRSVMLKVALQILEPGELQRLALHLVLTRTGSEQETIQNQDGALQCIEGLENQAFFCRTLGAEMAKRKKTGSQQESLGRLEMFWNRYMEWLLSHRPESLTQVMDALRQDPVLSMRVMKMNWRAHPEDAFASLQAALRKASEKKTEDLLQEYLSFLGEHFQGSDLWGKYAQAFLYLNQLGVSSDTMDWLAGTLDLFFASFIEGADGRKKGWLKKKDTQEADQKYLTLAQEVSYYQDQFMTDKPLAYAKLYLAGQLLERRNGREKNYDYMRDPELQGLASYGIDVSPVPLESFGHYLNWVMPFLDTFVFDEEHLHFLHSLYVAEGEHRLELMKHILESVLENYDKKYTPTEFRDIIAFALKNDDRELYLPLLNEAFGLLSEKEKKYISACMQDKRFATLEEATYWREITNHRF